MCCILQINIQIRQNVFECILPIYIQITQNVKKSIMSINILIKVSKGAKIRNRYNQVPHLTQDTNGKVTNSQLDTTNESQEVSPFPAGDHKAHILRRKSLVSIYVFS